MSTLLILVLMVFAIFGITALGCGIYMAGYMWIKFFQFLYSIWTGR